MNIPNIKFQTLNDARKEMVRFGITEKAPTLGHAKKLLLKKRAEISKAKATDQEKTFTDEATTTASKPVAKSPTAPKPIALDVNSYLALRMKQISGVYMTKAELAVLSFADDTTAVLEQAIEILCKTDSYNTGVLLINSYTTLQKCEATKDLDPRAILADLKASKAIAAKADREAKYFVTWRTSSK